MKKLALALLLLAFLAAGAAIAGYQLFARGIAGFDDWVVRKVVDIAELYLVPDVEFDDFDYASGVVTLKGVRLIAPDGTEVVSAGSARVTLAGIPTPVTGVVIETVELQSASLRLIREPGAEGGFRGLVPFVERKNIRNQERVPEDMRLSRAFEIRRIALAEGSVTYEPGAGQPPTRIDHINLDMDVKPVTDAPPDSRIYALNLAIDRAPILSISVDGRLDADALTLDLEKLAFDADLASEQAVQSLPGQLQQLVRDHEAHGDLALEATGRLLARNPLDSTLDATVNLTDFGVAAGEYRLPIDSGRIDVAYADRLARLTTLRIDACDGQITGEDVRIDLSGDAPHAQLAWNVAGFRLRHLLRTHSEGEEAAPKVAGVVSSTGSAQATLDAVPASISGAGEVSVREGRLVNLPLQTALAKALNVFDLIGKKDPTLKDQGDVTFTLDGEGIQVEKATVKTAILAARGKGTVHYDGRLDLLVNAGPLEKLQESTGIIGDIFGAITDQMVKYDVEGTVAEPEVKIRPLGIGG